MRTSSVVNPAGAHRGCEARKLYKLLKAGGGARDGHFCSFTYDTQVGVICIAMYGSACGSGSGPVVFLSC